MPVISYMNENKTSLEKESGSNKNEETEHKNICQPVLVAAPFTMNNLSTNYFFNKFLKKNTKPFAEREGDWICPDCKNLNFSFRTQCNRCKKVKEDADVIKGNKKENEEKKQIKNIEQNETGKEKVEKNDNKKEIERKKNIKCKKEKFQIKEGDGIETIKIVVNEAKKTKKNRKNKHKKEYKKFSEKNKNGSNEKMKKE